MSGYESDDNDNIIAREKELCEVDEYVEPGSPSLLEVTIKNPSASVSKVTHVTLATPTPVCRRLVDVLTEDVEIVSSADDEPGCNVIDVYAALPKTAATLNR